jgi:hypothetical protein
VDVSRGALDDFLAATDLDDLADAYGALAESLPLDDKRISHVLASWTDVQAVANLLMYPTVIPDELRVAALLRGIRSEGYLRLAAASGIGHLDPGALATDERAALIDALLDAVATDAAVTANRAAVSLAPLLTTADAPLVVELLDHPAPTVRHNLEIALLALLDTRELTAIIDAAETSVAASARARLIEDGIDLNRPSAEQERLPLLSYLPNYADWPS